MTEKGSHTIEYGPFGVRVGFLIIATVFVLTGALLIGFFVLKSGWTLQCRRTNDSAFSCRTDDDEWVAVDLKAGVKVSFEQSGDYSYHTLRIAAAAGRGSYSFGRIGKQEAQLAAKQLEAFAGNPSQREIERFLPKRWSDRAISAFSAGVLAVLAALFYFVALRGAVRFRVEIERAGSCVRLQRYWWFLRLGTHEVSTVDVTGVDLDVVLPLTPMQGALQRIRGSAVFRISLRTTSREVRPLTKRAYPGREVHERTREQLLSGLGLAQAPVAAAAAIAAP